MSKQKADNGEAPVRAGKRQREIPGTEPKTNPDLDAILGPFVNARYERMELEQEERRLHDEAISLMKTLKLPSYVYRDGADRYEIEAVHVEAKDKLRVKRTEEAEV
jgi:hypothetical protein